MADGIPLLDHELAEDELSWVKAIYKDFQATRASFANPKEALRVVMAKPEHQMAQPIDLSGEGPWRNGRNGHGRFAAAVFLKKIELHRHPFSRTDQFPMYVVGEADAFSLDADGQPVLQAVTGGDHFHNSPDAPHAFLPKVGQQAPDDWEIAFIAITPRNLREDTHAVTPETRAIYERAVGMEAPAGV